jgi:hypothetical protein
METMADELEKLAQDVGIHPSMAFTDFGIENPMELIKI